MTSDLPKKPYRFTAKRACYIAAMSAIIVVAKEAVSSIPNVEPVTILVCLFSVHFGVDTLFAVYIFDIVEGLIYGFHPLWWLPYLYVWPLLWLLARMLKKEDPPLVWALLMGIYGLCFGTLCTLPYFVVGDWAGGLAYFLSGLSFDLIHCVSNFLIGLLLWNPLNRALSHINY